MPGCHYPKIFSKNIDQLRNKSFVDCQVQELGMPSYHVECILNCRPGWSPINGINTTMCSQENQPFQPEKLTNFTVDYLECGRVFWGANDLREIIVKYIQTIKNNVDESLKNVHIQLHITVPPFLCLHLEYRKVASSRLSWLVALPRIFRRLMKGKFDALAKKLQKWIVDRSTARDFTVSCSNNFQFL